MKKFVLIFIFAICTAFLISGCGSAYYNISKTLPASKSVVTVLNSLYNPMIETSMCVSLDKVYNIITGTSCGVELPVCKSTDIVMHTHPAWATHASSQDFLSFDIYHNALGNTCFGIMTGINQFVIYERKPEFIGIRTYSTAEEVYTVRKYVRKLYKQIRRVYE